MGLDPREVRNRLDYNAETGVLVWKERQVASENPRRRCDMTWNTRYAGKVTGYKDSRYGYLVVNIDGRPYMAHRLAWAIHYGEWPKNHIDHINCNRQDNRLCNLRDATQLQNAMNRPVRADSASGVKGVQLHTQTGKWRARIRIRSKHISLGLFDTKEAAHKAYVDAAKEIFGEFAYKGLSA